MNSLICLTKKGIYFLKVTVVGKSRNIINFILVFFGMTLITLVVFWFGFAIYIYFSIPSKVYYGNLKEDQFPLSHFKKELLFKVGWVANPEMRANYFLDFSTAKEKNVIRIGTFGGSWTYGSAVEKGQSYPAQLMDLFNQFLKKNKVEVLNFGAGGYGFPQSFLLWEEYGKKYNLDYVLLGQSSFFSSKRNTSFINSWRLLNARSLRPPKGRYILKKNRKHSVYLQFVNIRGEDLLKRYRNYYSAFPLWEVIRYDRFFFTFWKKSFFPYSKPINNLFYYSDLSEEEEASRINKMLLDRMNKTHAKQILILSVNKFDHSDNYHKYETVAENYNINRINLFEEGNFLYRRRDHLSSLGNEMLAFVYYNALKGNKKFSVKMFRCHNKTTSNESPYGKPKGTKPEEIQNSFVKNTDYFTEQPSPISKGFQPSLRHINNSSNDVQTQDKKVVELFHNNLKIGELQSIKDKFELPNSTKNLIGFFGSDDFFTQGMYIPLPFQLNEQNQVFIQTKKGEKISLGYAFSIDESGFLWGFQQDNIFTQAFPRYRFKRLVWGQDHKKNFPASQTSLSLWVQNYKIANLIYKSKGQWYVNWLKPKEPLVFIGPGHYIRHGDMPETLDRISLSYTVAGNKAAVRSLIPNRQCKKKKIPVHLNLPNLNFL